MMKKLVNRAVTGSRCMGWNGPFSVLLIVALLLAFVPVAQAKGPPPQARAHPLLFEIAEETPDSRIRVIVQRQAGQSGARQAALQQGGVVLKDLPMINAFVLELPARAVEALAKAPGVRWVSLDAPVVSTFASTETVRDEFNAASYSGNDGTVTWEGEWSEYDVAGTGPTSGNIQIVSGELLLDDQPNSYTEPSISREVNLSDAVSAATFSFDFRTGPGVDAGDGVAIEVSSDGGANYTVLEIIDGISGAAWGQRSYEITGYVSADTMIRFRVDNRYGGPDEYFAVDNVQIEYTLPMTGTETVRDEFNAASYSGNDGTVIWEGAWIEYDVAGTGPTSGNIQIVSGELLLDDQPDSYTEPSISREVNLSDAVSAATFSFDFRTGPGVDAGDGIAIDVSSDGGANYNVLEIIDGIIGAASGERSYEITGYISADTMIRFRVYNRYGGPDEYFAVDNVQIEYTSGSGSAPTPTPAPEPLPENYYLDTLGVRQVWDMGLQGEGITVAVVDSGINKHHDLAATADLVATADLAVSEPVFRIVKSANFTNSAGDHYGHGTHVAGIIGGNGALSNGAYTGVAPLVNLLDIKISDNQGMAFTSDVVYGLQWIYENRDVYNIRVVNLSFNSTVPEPYHVSPLDAAVEILWFNGIVVVVSAGNNGDDPDAGTVYPPANDPFVITVGATDDMGTVDAVDDVLAAFSAYGRTAEGFAKPDVVAPGRNIISLLASVDCEVSYSHPDHRVNEYYFRMSGTSMATPIATGAVVLLLQDEPHLTPDQVKYRLMATARPFDTPGGTGAGYLDIYGAVQGTTTESANTGIAASQLLWTGEDPIVWDSVNWTSVNWTSVNWTSVNWTSVNWNSVNWNSTHWDD